MHAPAQLIYNVQKKQRAKSRYRLLMVKLEPRRLHRDVTTLLDVHLPHKRPSRKRQHTIVSLSLLSVWASPGIFPVRDTWFFQPIKQIFVCCESKLNTLIFGILTVRHYSFLFVTARNCSLLFVTARTCSLLLRTVGFCSLLLGTVPYCSLLLGNVRFCSLLLGPVPYCSLLLGTVRLCSLLLGPVPCSSLLLGTVRFCSLLIGTVFS